MRGKKWTSEEDAWLTEHYNNSEMDEMVAKLGKTVKAIYNRGMTLGLARSKRFLVPKTLSKGFVDGQYAKGHTPANKGQRMEEYCGPEAIERSKATRFPKGNIPHNTHEIGYECQRSDGYVWVKIRNDGPSYKMMVQKHRLVWERHHGPIPQGHIVKFKDGNRANCDIGNLYLVSRSEHLDGSKKKRRPHQGVLQHEDNELLRRALEPFRPTRTMDDVLRREAEIREASLDVYKEEAMRMRKDRHKN